MYKLALIVLLALSTTLANDEFKAPKQIKVAVIDSGYDFESTWSGKVGSYHNGYGKVIRRPNLCPEGHEDFTRSKQSKKPEKITDSHGHGTHIAGVIAQYAGDANYCLIILKYYHPFATGEQNLRNSIRALRKAKSLKVDIINYSGGGPIFSMTEYNTVQSILNDDIKLVVAAGNDYPKERVNVDQIVGGISEGKPFYFDYNKNGYTFTEPQYLYYPAAIDTRIIAVQSIDKKGKLLYTSNRGKAYKYKEVGDKILSLLPNNKLGKMSGTSQATAVKTGKMIKRWKR